MCRDGAVSKPKESVSPSSSASYDLVDVDTELAKVNFGQVNLLHQLFVCIGNIVEGKDAETEAEKEEGAKGDEGPEGKLFLMRRALA